MPTVKYKLYRDGTGLICGGSPASLRKGGTLTLCFDAVSDGCVYINGKLRELTGGTVILPEELLGDGENRITVQGHDRDGFTRKWRCEALNRGGSDLIGADASADRATLSAKNKQLADALFRLEAAEKDIKALTARIASAEKALAGTDVLELK